MHLSRCFLYINKQLYIYTFYLKVHKYDVKVLVGNRWHTHTGLLRRVNEGIFMKIWVELRSTRQWGAVISLGLTELTLRYKNMATTHLPAAGRPGRGQWNEHTDRSASAFYPPCQIALPPEFCLRVKGSVMHLADQVKNLGFILCFSFSSLSISSQ